MSSKEESRLGRWWGRAGPALIVTDAGSFSWPSYLGWPTAPALENSGLAQGGNHRETLAQRASLQDGQDLYLRVQFYRPRQTLCSPGWAPASTATLGGVWVAGTKSSSALPDVEEGWSLPARFCSHLCPPPHPLGLNHQSC